MKLHIGEGVSMDEGAVYFSHGVVGCERDGDSLKNLACLCNLLQ